MQPGKEPFDLPNALRAAKLAAVVKASAATASRMGSQAEFALGATARAIDRGHELVGNDAQRRLSAVFF
jgi:hypothetical protein